MFIALYQMTAKPERQQDFEEGWAEVTEWIYKKYGSLGSRLHKTEKERVYIAYAQWPSRETYFADHDEPSGEELAARQRMREATEKIETLHLMDVSDDRWRTQPYEA